MQYEYSERVSKMKPSIIRALLKQMSNSDLISFAGGNPSAEAFPAGEICRISDELLRNDAAATLQYSITEGYTPLRAAGEAYLNKHWPVKKQGDDLIVTSGSQQVMDFMAKLLCNPGDVVACEDPAFLGALNSFRSFDVKLVGIPLQDDGVDLQALEAAFAASPKPRFYYTIPNFQNPTGVTTSAEKRKAVYELAVRYGVPVLEDNPYGELRISGEDIAPIKALDEEGAVVYAASMSKILAPGMRVAFCVGPAELLGKMVVAKQGNDVHTNVWAQRVCERFLTECDMDGHIARLRGIYREKAMCMLDELERQMPDKLRYVTPEGGMFLWLHLPKGVDMLQYVQKCLDKKLALVPGNAFFVDDAAPCDAVRANFTTPTAEQIKTGVGIMAEVLEEQLKNDNG